MRPSEPLAPTPSPAERREAALRNAGRLAALAHPPQGGEGSTSPASGLVVAAIAADAAGARHTLPPEHAAAAAIASLPGVVLWAWPASALPEEIGRDLAAARASLGDDARAVVVLRAHARVLSPPLEGEVGAEVEGVDAVPLVRAVGGLDEGELVRGVDVPWSEAAERRVSAAGFVARAPRD
jgi:hypothetical protein